jgi:hypothetical protein
MIGCCENNKDENNKDEPYRLTQRAARRGIQANIRTGTADVRELWAKPGVENGRVICQWQSGVWWMDEGML